MTISLPNDGFGLNKEARRATERRIAEGEPPVQEGEFPWEVLGFPYGEFSAEPSGPEPES
jgi:hypothetical protein